MTYEEVMKKIDYLHDLPDYDRNPYCLGNRVRYWAELKKHFDKYRWHDLRKNPDDLPQQNKNVIFATSDGSVQEGEWNYTCWIQYRWTTHRNNSEVIAWREIEPFEEVEE